MPVLKSFAQFMPMVIYNISLIIWNSKDPSPIKKNVNARMEFENLPTNNMNPRVVK